ncbi:unnamed protein product [Oppiella nova]|uniref:C2 domain-containing protein n=1 Tax=Oppiella nova TaxID=334625 RepID=A0A7R9L9N1_9ACAR|nr:unnamed protein product [Oppiella nova]CAG2160615.1 unnamed protein product [Oppiella nova]
MHNSMNGSSLSTHPTEGLSYECLHSLLGFLVLAVNEMQFMSQSVNESTVISFCTTLVLLVRDAPTDHTPAPPLHALHTPLELLLHALQPLPPESFLTSRALQLVLQCPESGLQLVAERQMGPRLAPLLPLPLHHSIPALLCSEFFIPALVVRIPHPIHDGLKHEILAMTLCHRVRQTLSPLLARESVIRTEGAVDADVPVGDEHLLLEHQWFGQKFLQQLIHICDTIASKVFLCELSLLLFANQHVMEVMAVMTECIPLLLMRCLRSRNSFGIFTDHMFVSHELSVTVRVSPMGHSFTTHCSYVPITHYSSTHTTTAFTVNAFTAHTLIQVSHMMIIQTTIITDKHLQHDIRQHRNDRSVNVSQHTVQLCHKCEAPAYDKLLVLTMPGKVKVRVLAGRNLPVMDKSSDTSDAFVEVKLGNTTYKTEVYRRSLNPFWNSEWFRFEVDDEELQDEPLQIRVMDYDTYSANDAIGKIYIDLNPLLSKDSRHVMSGWFPIYDTMHGIRGEINCVVKVALFSDANRYRQSSCGFKFFYSPAIPFGYECEAILGFVEELVVNHDPEYQWIDKIRTPRASNEARQALFSKISGEVQRRIGIKAIDLGGNAVVSYQQYFDMEGESGIVVRGIGTAVLLNKVESIHHLGSLSSQFANFSDPGRIAPIGVAFLSNLTVSINPNWSSNSSTPSPPVIHRTPSPSPRFSSSIFKLIRQSVKKKRPVIGLSLEAETTLPVTDNKPIKPLKRVASQPVTVTLPSTSCVPNPLRHDYSTVSLSRSPNPNEDNALVSSSPPLRTTPIPMTAPILTPNKALSPTKTNHLGVYGQRRLSEPDLSGSAPKGHSGLSNSSGSGSSGRKYIISPESLHLLEYPFITMKSFPSNLILHIGGVVSARSVKLLDQINNPDDPETRDVWWTELRKEIRSHNRALACNAVLGYTESTHICDEICILSASGTAAVLKTGDSEHISNLMTNANISSVSDKKETIIECEPNVANKALKVDINLAQNHLDDKSNCHLCHIPYSETSVPFPATLVKCMICKRAKVPDVLFMTIEPPKAIPILGHGTLIQARVCRSKKESKGEQCAKELSDGLPFLEYELHRQLLSKLKVKGMNGLFNISVQVSFGENMLIAVATGTGAFLSPLLPPSPPKISSGKGIQCSKLNEIQGLIMESIARNREHYNIFTSGNNNSAQNGVNVIEDKDDDNDDSNDAIMDSIFNPKIDLNNGNKESCVLLEVDDTEDADIISLMIDSDVPKGYEVCNSECLPGMQSQLVCNLQMFSQVYRAKLTSIKQFGHQFDWVIQSLFVKFRRLIPCCLTDLKFRVDLPEADLVQITVVGTAIGIGPPMKHISRSRKPTESGDTDLMFTMDAIGEQKMNEQNVQNISPTGAPYHTATNEHFGIELTPLSYIPSGQIDNYLGNLDFFFIRESTSIREFGGLSGFIHSFLTEVFAMVRSHVSSLGGNAMTSFHITQLLLLYNPHKNQAQCLVNVAGDAVIVRYDSKEKTRTNNSSDEPLGSKCTQSLHPMY